MANKNKQQLNLHEFMNKHRKKVLTFISLTVVASMVISLIAQALVFF